MQERLDWRHGIEFVCLAFQNAMAALTNGYTTHNWSAIQASKTTEGGTGCLDAPKLATRCQSMRVIIVDEHSMA